MHSIAVICRPSGAPFLGATIPGAVAPGYWLTPLRGSRQGSGPRTVLLNPAAHAARLACIDCLFRRVPRDGECKSQRRLLPAGGDRPLDVEHRDAVALVRD